MIKLRTQNDVLNGVIELYDNSSLINSFQRAFIELPDLGLSEELNAGSNPTLSNFLSPNSISGIKFSTKLDKVLTLKYTLLSQIDNSGLSYTLGDNIVYKVGIYNLFSGTDYIYINKLYLIDKALSSQDQLWLKEPIQEVSSSVYIAFYSEQCITVLYQIPQELKKLTLQYSVNCCNDCIEGEILTKAYRYIEALKIQQDCNDCNTQREILQKLKKALQLC